MINVFYGCARRHRPFHYNVNVITNDIDKKCYSNLTGDIRDILKRDFWIKRFDAYIFTPPCNYYSRANWRRETSPVAQETKDLLPLCLDFAVNSGHWFLVENVLNKTMFKDLYPQYQFTFGGHTFWSNVLSKKDVLGLTAPKQNKQYVSRNMRDGNYAVDLVINMFLQEISDMEINSLC